MITCIIEYFLFITSGQAQQPQSQPTSGFQFGQQAASTPQPGFGTPTAQPFTFGGGGKMVYFTVIVGPLLGNLPKDPLLATNGPKIGHF